MHVLETLNFTEEERMAYEDRLKWWRLEAGTIEKFQKKAKEEGRQEGIQIGEEKRNIEIVKAMLQKGCLLEDVVLLTGLSIKQVKALQ